MAITFDSTSDRVTIGTTALPLIGSISLWVKPTWAQTDGVQHMFFDTNAGDNTHAFSILHFTDNKIYAGCLNTTDYRVIVASANYTLNQNAWNHIAVTWDDTANVTKCYLNGSQIGSSTSTLVMITSTAEKSVGNGTIGQTGTNAASDIAELGIWNAVLDADEITALNKAYAPSCIRPTALVDYVPMLRDAINPRGPVPAFTNTAVANHPRIVYPKGGVQNGIIPKMILQSLDGTLTSSGALVRSVSKNVAGTLTSSGSLVRLALKNPKGTLTSSGALVKSVSKNVAGTLTTAGALVKSVSRHVSGTLTTSGILSKLVLKATFTGTLTTVGALTRTFLRSVAGTLTTAGSLSKSASKNVAGTLTSAGALVKSVDQHVAGTLTSAGSLVKAANRTVTGVLAASGSLARAPSISMAGYMTINGSLAKTASKLFTGVLDFIGSLTSVFPAKAVIITDIVVNQPELAIMNVQPTLDAMSGQPVLDILGGQPELDTVVVQPGLEMIRG